MYRQEKKNQLTVQTRFQVWNSKRWKDSLGQDNYQAMCPHIQKQPFSTQVHHPQCASKDQNQLSLLILAEPEI